MAVGEVRSRLRTTLDIAASVAMLAAAGVLIWTQVGTAGANRPRERKVATPNAPISLAGLPVEGNPGAPAAIIEFSDFQCPFCGKFARETYPVLKEKYVSTGKALFAFRHLPLTQLHPFARRFAAGAACAQGQGKFWEMHDSLFKSPLQPSEETLTGRAKEAGVEPAAFSECLTQPDKQVEADLALARELGINSTPIFFVGKVTPSGVKISTVLAGAKSLADFDAAIAAAR